MSPFLLKVFEESIQNEALPPTLTQGLITLIPKPKKDLLLIDNWRPVSLLNSDYKILTIIFAKRLKYVLGSVIDETQSVFLNKRHIVNNIRLILDLLDYSDLIQEDSFILFLDFYKAFDSLEHQFIINSLEKFGFGDMFCRVIKTLYNNGSASIKLKNGTSPRFSLSRGVRQGCPISPYLFLLCVQLLSTFVCESSIRGIRIADREIFMSQLADDTTLFLRDASQIPIAINYIKLFSKASGLNLNIGKCELMSIKDCIAPTIFNIPVKSEMTYLGIVITKNQDKRCTLNFDPVIIKAQRRFNAWLQRDLTLRGRVLLAKAEGISRLTYAALSLYVNNKVCKSVDKILFNFVWKNKIHYVKKSVIMNTYEYGGLNFLDFSSLNNTFKINWIRQFLCNPNSIWNFIPNYFFSKLGGLPFLLICNYNIARIPYNLSKFHKQSLLAWSLIFKHNFSPHRYFIWNNQDIVYKRKSLFFSNWFEKNILIVSQLFNSEGLILSYEEFLCKFDFPVTPKEFSIVMDAIPKGVVMLLRDFVRSPSTLPISLDPFEIPVGKLCFLSHPSSRNYKIRSLFQKELVTTPYVVSYWKNVVDHIDWKKVWTLSSKYIITNKVRDISFKLLHRFYPTKVFLKRFKSDIDTSCAFCGDPNETDMHIFWDCPHTQLFWIEFSNIINRNVLQGFSLLFKDVLFGFFNIQKVQINEYFIINLLLLLAKFHIHRSKFTHQNPLFIVFKKEVQQYIQAISSSKNLKALKTVNLFNLFNFC